MAADTAVPERSDVVVVGGGIMGTSAAFFLARRGDSDVTLIERDHIAAGSTGDSSAILRHHYGPQEIYARSARWAHRFYRRFEAETGQPLAYAANPLVRAGSTDTPAGRYVEAGARVLEDLDIPVTRYSAEEVARAWPMFDFGDCDVAVSDDDAAYADGTDAATGLARAAREHGATIVTGVSVTGFAVEDGAIDRVETDAGDIRCGAVVLAVGPWTPRLAAALGIEVPLVVEREQVVILEPPSAFVDAHPRLAPTTALPGGAFYLRPDFGDGILVATHHTGEAVAPDDYPNTPDEDTLLELVELLEAAIPEVVDADIRGQYCGVYSTTPDHDFIIDRAGPDGCVIACGFSGHGFKHGPTVGRVVADLVEDGATDVLDVDYFSLDRFEDDPAGHGLPADLA
ncbi:MAG: NAD(P)/FAD-dependent oxidoreductase [Halobacteriales archaeon]